MKNYRADIRLRKEAMTVIVRSLTYSDIEELNKAFDALDNDKNGYITSDELQLAMKQEGMDSQIEMIQEIIREADYVGNGKINYSEFIAASLTEKVYMNEEKLWQAFQFFDTDKSGFITAENLKEALAKVGKVVSEEEIQNMIKDVDIHHDNRISFEEFKNMMDPKGLMSAKLLDTESSGHL